MHESGPIFIIHLFNTNLPRPIGLNSNRINRVIRYAFNRGAVIITDLVSQKNGIVDLNNEVFTAGV